MARVRALDIDHDWQFGKGQNDYLRDNAAIMQNIDTRLNAFLGDCFFDQTAGIDWLTLIGGKNQLALNLAISATILNTVGVAGILQLSSTLVDRIFEVRYQVLTVYSRSAGLFKFNTQQAV